MRQSIRSLCRRPAVLVLLLFELLVVLGALWAAAKPAVTYTFTPDQWEVIAQASSIEYDADGRRGVTEMTDGEPILQTPAMSLPAGHYRVTLDYRYEPGRTEEEIERRSSVYFTAEEEMSVSGERAWVNVQAQQDTVVLNVDYASDTIRLVADNDGGIFTIGNVEIRQDMAYAWACVLGWFVVFALVDLALVLLVPGSPKALRDADLRGCLWLLGAVTVLTCVPLLMNSGGAQGADWRFHLSRIEGIAQALREGQFPVRVYSQAKDGYGYAPSLFYGELFLYFPAALRLLGMSVQGAYRTYAIAVQALTAGISFFSFRQMFRHNKTALVGSILYMLAPYHIYNIYWRTAVGEYTALAFLPLIPAALSLLYAQQKPDRHTARVACAELVVSFGALVQTHIISLELTTLSTAVFCLYHFRRTFTKRILGVWVTAAGLVVLLNLWFLVPFLTLMLGGGYNNMYGGESFAGGLSVQKNGLWLSELLSWRADHNSIGVVLVAGLVAFVWCWLTQGPAMPQRERKIGAWAAVLGTLACWMCANTFPWGILGSLPVVGRLLLAIQFPWRYFSLATLLLVLVSVCAVSALRRGRYAQPVAVLLLSASLLGVAIFYHSYLPTVDTSYLGDRAQMIYTDYKISNMAWYYDSLYLPDGAVETRDGFTCETAVTTVEIASVERRGNTTVLSCSEVNGELGYAELPLLYYPGYTIVDGEGEVFRTANGMVGVTVPAGFSGEISVAFREPKRWLAADLVSLVTLLGLLGYGVRSIRRKKSV
ncbi:MAG: hypothetical protein UCO57_10540 [Gemmiger sp.]|uniref:hypothetical protein n=1 Tax=Gemmiger sp. TaxID=2049027 RepID=UPI002E79CE35|nr:hypothetical protein [Gemmiger sp.]MEE0709200.1 hypothetical protein [Gemmiger sp.]